MANFSSNSWQPIHTHSLCKLNGNIIFTYYIGTNCLLLQRYRLVELYTSNICSNPMHYVHIYLYAYGLIHRQFNGAKQSCNDPPPAQHLNQNSLNRSKISLKFSIEVLFTFTWLTQRVNCVRDKYHEET